MSLNDPTPNTANNANLRNMGEPPSPASYDEWVEAPPMDTPFIPEYNAIRIAPVDGDVEVVDGLGTTRTLSQRFLKENEILPLTIAEIKSSGTTQTVSNIMLLRE